MQYESYVFFYCIALQCNTIKKTMLCIKIIHDIDFALSKLTTVKKNHFINNITY